MKFLGQHIAPAVPLPVVSLQNITPAPTRLVSSLKGLELIPSENFTSVSVMQAVGSVMTNKYSEGYPGARYYGGNDLPSSSCPNLISELTVFLMFVAVNVQPLSGSPANFQVYTALLRPHERIMALDLPHGGHLSHGYQVTSSSSLPCFSRIPTAGLDLRLSYTAATAIFLTEIFLTRGSNPSPSMQLERSAALFRPKLIVAGASAYARLYDYARIRKVPLSLSLSLAMYVCMYVSLSLSLNGLPFSQVCDKQKAVLLADMAHISGLYADVVTTTTHKSLRGPRGAMIFFRKGLKEVMYDYEDRVNQAVFPGLQGGPHNHTIAGLAVALKQAMTPEYRAYQAQVLSNCSAFAQALIEKGYDLVSGGTDNHLVLVNLKNKGIDGSRVEKVLELVHIAANKNTVPGDVSAMVPGGIRMGTPALTSRGFVEEDFVKVAEFFDAAVKLALKIKAEPKVGRGAAQAFSRSPSCLLSPANDGVILFRGSGTKLKDFTATIQASDGIQSEIKELRLGVEEYAKQFPTIGFEKETMKYKN
ncbi:unnamed protein product [Spirodela intermedia]|uniref:Serine hydroxymethyltransferase n=1 Tax=Spirodela intermedia TaxID=51605 RepID=A0A7I8JBQ7_SPIIN|nr:unnamed protein product [Spirodela intermedia]CAA6667534.1 unnamed protein product [Spirodela intermedia]